MKIEINIKSTLVALSAIFAFGLMTSCQEDVILANNVDLDNYDKINHVYGSVRNMQDSRLYAVSELRTTDLKVDFRVELTKAFDGAIDAKMRLDRAIAEQYNSEHNTDFEMFPADLISIEEDGAILIAPGDTKSVPVTITIKPGSQLTQGATYLVPITTDVITKGTKLKNLNYVLLVRYMGQIPDCTKTPNVKVISCMEINATNPLNHLEYWLEDSGKMLYDIVVLFSANINYDSNTGRVYLHCNENIQAMLTFRERYLKPLQDRGMKVVLGVMGNHNQGGVANMSDPMAMEFAAELKSYCEAYNLDGIFYDDEYSEYRQVPGFVYPASYRAAARLIYEVKKAMPDKLNIVYAYNLTDSFLFTIDGVEPGQFIDYALPDYGKTLNENSYLGISMKQLGYYSQEFAKGMVAGDVNGRELVAKGYGANMIFAMDPFRTAGGNFNAQLYGMRGLATGVFNDKLVWSGAKHYKNW